MIGRCKIPAMINSSALEMLEWLANQGQVEEHLDKFFGACMISLPKFAYHVTICRPSRCSQTPWEKKNKSASQDMTSLEETKTHLRGIKFKVRMHSSLESMEYPSYVAFIILQEYLKSTATI